MGFWCCSWRMGSQVSSVVRITPHEGPFGRGPTNLLRDLRSPWLLTTYKSLDDPPSLVGVSSGCL